MKNVLVLILVFTTCLGSLFAQSYRSSQFVGDWKIGDSEIYLAENGYAKFTYLDGNSYRGNWNYSGAFETKLTINLSNGHVFDWDVASISTNKIIVDETVNTRYHLVRKSATSRNSYGDEAAAAVVLIGTAALLYSIFGDSGSSDSNSYNTDDYYSIQRRKQAEAARQAEYDMNRRGN